MSERRVATPEQPMPSSRAEAYVGIAMQLSAVLVALAGGAVVIAASGVSPLLAYRELLKGAFGSTYSMGEVFVRAIPIGLCGLAFTVARRGGLLNIGAEGQLYVGALGATLVALFFAHLPRALLLPLALVVAAAFGALWGAIPAVLKARWRVNEFVNTVMMNYVGLYLVNYLVSGPLREVEAGGGGAWPQTEMFSRTVWMPIIVRNTRLNAGILLFVAMAVLAYVLLWRTSWGYQVRVVGHNPRAARYAGMRQAILTVQTLGLAGALAGLGGAIEVTGVLHRLYANFSPGYGFTGIAVSLLAGNHPLGVIVTAVFFSALRVGARSMESNAGVSFYINTVIEALALFAFLISGFISRRLAGRPGD